LGLHNAPASRGSSTVEETSTTLINLYEKQSSFTTALFKAIAIKIDLDNPFELHIVTEEEYLRVYRRFIDVSQEIT
jgi:hypothetical protein